MNQPAWLKQMKKEKPVKEQITILGGSPLTQPQNYGQGFTGLGSDGILQPGKMAGQVHEGEGVIRANAMQNLHPSEFQLFQTSLENGTLDKNKFREAIGMGPIMGYQTGGIVGQEPFKPQYPESQEQQNTQPAAPLSSLPDVIQPINRNTATTPPKQNITIPGLSSQDSNLVMNQYRDMASGKAFEPYNKAANTYDLLQSEILAKAGKNMQQTAANTAAARGWTGQGAGNELQGQVNQGLMENLSTNLLQRNLNRQNLAQQQQNMMQQGAQGLLNIGSQVELFNQQNKIDTGKRINTLVASGADINSITNDSYLRNQIAQDLGVTPNDQAVTNEIQTLYKASIDTNANAYGGDAEELLQDYVTMGRTLEDALKDQNIFRKTALSMRLDPDDQKNLSAIQEEITRRFNDRSMSDVDRAYKNIMDSGLISDEIKSVTGFDKDLRGMIRDLALKGYIDPETGSIKEGAVVEWPWEDPDTFFKYNDFNGNALDGQKIDLNSFIDIEGNGTTYKGNHGKVNQHDASMAWEKVTSPIERESYFKEDGSFNTKKFMDKFFRTTIGKDGQPVPVTTREDFDNRFEDEEFAREIGDLIDSWSTTAVYPGKPEEGGLAGNPIGSDQFLYYDRYGDPQVESKDNGKLAYIWQQLSDKYGKGSMLTAEQFRGFWQEGKGYLVDDDGTILNLDDRGSNKAADEALKVVQPAVERWSKGRDKDVLYGIIRIGNESEISKLNLPTLGVEGAKSVSASWDKVSKEMKASQTPFDFVTGDMIDRRSGVGSTNRWVFKDSVTNWVKANVGKLWKNEHSGRVYMVLGQYDEGHHDTTEYMLLMDMGTGEVVRFSNEHDNGKTRGLQEEGYE